MSNDFEATRSDPDWHWNVEMNITINVMTEKGPAELLIIQPSAQVGTSNVRGAFIQNGNRIDFTFNCTSRGFRDMLRGLECNFDEFCEPEPEKACKHGSTSVYETCVKCQKEADK
jgi:hypothetical protein